MNIKSRSVIFAEYVVEHNTTIRKTAEYFDISKSTVHNDLSKKLCVEDFELYKKVQKILNHNFEVKHLRGGLATKEKYSKLKKKG